MLNTLMLLVNRFRPKTEIDHKVIAESVKQTEPRNQLVHVPSKLSNFELNEIRQRANDELRTSDVSARQRDRALLNKWFNRGELTESGSFNIAELQRRMEEPTFSEEESIGALPAQEDMLMAFCKPEIDLFEEEKISLSGVFLRVNPNEDFDEQYSMPLLPMYSPAEAANHIIMLDEHPSTREEFNLSFSVEETSSDQMPLSIPVPVPAFIPLPVAVVEERKASKIDPSVLFEEWTSDLVFDPASSEAASTFGSELTSMAVTPCELGSSGSVSIEIVSSEIVSELTSTETLCQSTSQVNTKPYVKLVAKQNDAYWSESDRLTRFGRRRTSASCSSTRLRALTQIA